MGLSANQDSHNRQKIGEKFKLAVALTFVLGFAVYVYYGPYRPLAVEFNDVRAMTVSEKMSYWGAFLAKEAPLFGHVAKLGGGPQVWDRVSVTPAVFNPLNFVETVVALAKSDSRDEYYENVLKLRYRGGKPHTKNRNFLASIHWIKENTQNGSIRNVTKDWADDKSQISLKLTVDVAKWLKKDNVVVDRALASFGSAKETDVRELTLSQIPLSQVGSIEGKLPVGSIVALIGSACRSDPVICRMGIVKKTEGGQTILLRSTESGVIVSEKLNDFLSLPIERNLAGITVFSVVRPL